LQGPQSDLWSAFISSAQHKTPLQINFEAGFYVIN